MLVVLLSSFDILTWISPASSIRLIIFEAEVGSCNVNSMIRFCVNPPFGFSKFYAFMPSPRMTPKTANFIAALITNGYLKQIVGV